MLAERTAVQDFAFDVITVNRTHFQLDTPVGQQYPRSPCYFASKFGKIAGNNRRGASHFAWRNSQQGTGFQRNVLPVFQKAGANLRALQVLENTNRPLQLMRDSAQPLDSPSVFRMGSVRKI